MVMKTIGIPSCTGTPGQPQTIEGRLIVGPFLCTLLSILTRILMYFRLFPMGDMPEILHSLIAKGRAILWSSQEKEGYQVR